MITSAQVRAERQELVSSRIALAREAQEREAEKKRQEEEHAKAVMDLAMQDRLRLIANHEKLYADIVVFGLGELDPAPRQIRSNSIQNTNLCTKFEEHYMWGPVVRVRTVRFRPKSAMQDPILQARCSAAEFESCLDRLSAQPAKSDWVGMSKAPSPFGLNTPGREYPRQG